MAVSCRVSGNAGGDLIDNGLVVSGTGLAKDRFELQGTGSDLLDIRGESETTTEAILPVAARSRG